MGFSTEIFFEGHKFLLYINLCFSFVSTIMVLTLDVCWFVFAFRRGNLWRADVAISLIPRPLPTRLRHRVFLNAHPSPHSPRRPRPWSSGTGPPAAPGAHNHPKEPNTALALIPPPYPIHGVEECSSLCAGLPPPLLPLPPVSRLSTPPSVELSNTSPSPTVLLQRRFPSRLRGRERGRRRSPTRAAEECPPQSFPLAALRGADGCTQPTRVVEECPRLALSSHPWC